MLGTIDRPRPGHDLLNAARLCLAAHPASTRRAFESDHAHVREIAFHVAAAWSADQWASRSEAMIEAVIGALQRAEGPTYPIPRVVDALASLGGREAETATMLMRLAHARAEGIRGRAAAALGRSEKHADLLLELLVSEDAGERAFAVAGLAPSLSQRPSGAAAAGLWNLLHSERDVVRRAAGRLLVSHGGYIDVRRLVPRDAEAFALAAVDLLSDPEARVDAAMRLGSLGPCALPHVDALLDVLAEDPLHGVGNRAAVALRLIGAHDEAVAARVLPRLEAVFVGDDPIAAAAAAHGLVGSGRDELLVEVLPGLMRDPRKEVHFNAVDAARQMGDAARPLVAVLLEIAAAPPESSHVDQWACVALERLVPGDARFVRLLIDGLLDPRESERHNWFRATLTKHAPVTVPHVAEALDAADATGRVRLLEVLTQMGEQAAGARGRIAELAEDPHRGVARAARVALGRIGSANAAAPE